MQRRQKTTTHIICVDDERPVLDSIVYDIDKSIDHLGRKHNVSFNVEACTSAKECIEFLSECDGAGEEVACIITDIRMPEMTGDELLDYVRFSHPRTGKIILTGYADLDSIIENLFTKLHLIKYLKKPYRPDTLLQAIDAAVTFFFQNRSPVLVAKGITIKEVESKHELEEAFRLAYDILLEQQPSTDSYFKLRGSERRRRQKISAWDFQGDVKQIIAIKDKKVIGRVRLNFNELPLARYFQVPDDDGPGRTRAEISSLFVAKEHRGAGLYIGLVRYAYHFLKHIDDVYISNQTELDGFCSKMGFKKVGEYRDQITDMTYSVMHCYVPDFLHRHQRLKKIGLNPLFRKLLLAPLPQNDVQGFIQRQQSKILNLWYATLADHLPNASHAGTATK